MDLCDPLAGIILEELELEWQGMSVEVQLHAPNTLSREMGRTPSCSTTLEQDQRNGKKERETTTEHASAKIPGPSVGFPVKLRGPFTPRD